MAARTACEPPHTTYQCMTLCSLDARCICCTSLQQYGNEQSAWPASHLAVKVLLTWLCCVKLHSTAANIKVVSKHVCCCGCFHRASLQLTWSSSASYATRSRGSSAALRSLSISPGTWLYACRHWVHLAWDNRAIETLVHQRYPQLLRTFDRLQHTVMKGDIGRYLALHQ